MSEFKGTPGPWAIGADGERIITDYRDKNGNMVDSNWLKGGWAKAICGLRYASWMNPEEAKNNGHLIAAAPDLLEALMKFTEDYVEMVNSGDCGFWDPENEKKVKAARAAIAKALGEQK